MLYNKRYELGGFNIYPPPWLVLVDSKGLPKDSNWFKSQKIEIYYRHCIRKRGGTPVVHAWGGGIFLLENLKRAIFYY